MKVRTERSRSARWRGLAAKIAVLGLVSTGAVMVVATGAGADSPNPGATQTATGVLNGDGTITVTVTGTWAWTKNCDDVDGTSAGDKRPGWAVSWGSGIGTQLISSPSIYVGKPGDNLVHYDATLGACTDNGSNSSGTFTEKQSYTYPAGTLTISICVVTYDYHLGETSGNHSNIAAGANHNEDNSVEENEESPASGCAPVTLAPDTKIVKTGPASATVGTNFSYTLTVTNIGPITATNLTVTDVLPASLTFVSATSPDCAYASGTKTVTCTIASLAIAASKAFTVTVTPTAAGSLANTATVGPTDPTPANNTSTFTIGNVAVAAAVVVTPAFTG